jgi:hypothetical protein
MNQVMSRGWESKAIVQRVEAVEKEIEEVSVEIL